MDWAVLKDKVYFNDGSLRDIYVRDVNEDDWRKWIDFVNGNYIVSFKIYEGEEVAPKIEFDRVLQFWNGDRDSGAMATIFVGRAKVNTFFFENGELDNDITPTEFLSIDDHNLLMNYLKAISTQYLKPAKELRLNFLRESALK